MDDDDGLCYNLYVWIGNKNLIYIDIEDAQSAAII